MAQDLSTQLTFTADATGVETGVGRAKKSLADLGASAQTAGKQANDGLSTIGAGAEGAAKKVSTQTNNLVSSIQRQIASIEAGSRSGSKFFETLANQRGVPLDALKPYLVQLDQVIAKQKEAAKGSKFTPTVSTLTSSLGATNFSKPLDAVGTSLGATAFGAIAASATKATSAVAAFDSRFNSAGLTAKQTAAALRQVPSQLTDILVSLQGGQAPLTVLLQQGGQLRDIFGGIAPAAKALGNAVLGLINPYTIAAGAVAALALAYKQGSAEADEFARAIILSGNAAGTTVGQLQGMAVAISDVVGTQGKAAEALAAFAASGDVAADNLQKVATAAIRLERTSGQAISKTVEQFSSLSKEPLQASLKLNESTRFLTASLYQQIKALDDVGRTADAAAVAQRGYADVIESRTAELENRLGLLERSWLGVKDAAKSAWDAMLNVGRPESTQQKIVALQSQLDQLNATPSGLSPEFGGSSDASRAAQAAALQARIDALQGIVRGENEVASAAKKAADQVKARGDFDKDGLRFLSERVKMEREIAKAREQGIAAGASQAEIDKRIADIRESFAKKGPKGPKPEDPSKNELAAQIALTKNLLDQEAGAYRNSESILEAIRSAGLTNEAEYYSAKRAFINLNTEAEIRALEAQKKLLQAENERIEGQKGKQKEFIDNKKKIADAEAQIAIVTAQAAAKLTVTTIQQEAAVARLAASLLTARQAAQDFFDQQERQQGREIAGIGRGELERGRDRGVSQIEDRFADQRRELENQRALLELEGKFTDEARKQYDERLRIISEFQGKSIASFNEYYDRLIEKQRDFALGATEALNNYINEAKNLGSQIEGAFTNAFGGLEDVLTEFFTKGKADFKSFFNAIHADITRIVVRQAITQPLAESILGGFNSGEGIGGLLKRGLGGLLGGPEIVTGTTGPLGPLQGIAGEAAKTAGIAANTAALAAQTAALGASTAASTASAAAESAASVAIATASASSAAALAALTSSAIAASAALATVGASSAVPSIAGVFGFGTPMATGTNYVPYDGFPAMLHKGEAVVPAAYNPAAGGSSSSMSVVVHNHFSGNVTKETMEQGAAATGRVVRDAMKRGTAPA
jgi:lambda family phage tail tape measure protein